MKVSELIEELEQNLGTEEVYVAVQTHNFWRMVAVKKIIGVDWMLVQHSEYLQSLQAIDPEDTTEAELETKYALVIRITE